MVRKEKGFLGEDLVEAGAITLAQLKQAREEGKRTGRNISSLLVSMGFIGEADLANFLSEKLELPRIELENYLIDPKIVELVPEELAKKYTLIPVLRIGDRLTCAMSDPGNVFAMDEVRMRTNMTIEPAISTETEIRKAIGEYYGTKGSVEDLIKSIDGEKLAMEEAEAKLEEIVEEPLVIKLVNMIIMEAIKLRASDIHIEPEEHELKVRFRVDGMLREATTSPKHLQFAIISRIKIMAKLDIAENRKPQDGRFSIKTEGKGVDVRISCMPTIYGENVVLRLLDTTSALLELRQLGFSQDILDKYQKLIVRPHGIILVTGPTGSGKTTTLYAALDKINTVDKHIITIEDPVEYNLAGIRQIQVNPKVDLTFANGLRSILRQDPDIIMVGEMRDFETAEIAIQAALTGHLVFSTLHTNDASSCVVRLVNMGVEPFLITSSLIGVLAQRLVRTICPDCKEKYVPDKEELADVGILDDKGVVFYRGKGCNRCMNTGYRGRIGIFELMIPNDDINKLIITKAQAGEIRREALAGGMISIKDDGLEKVRQGLTTVEEILRVTEERD